MLFARESGEVEEKHMMIISSLSPSTHDVH
jgi:hypothetical protein